jgi:sulfur relay (sulfurtransferase) DsrC/TusE family protein
MSEQKMSGSDITEIPQAVPGDRYHAFVKTILSGVPVVGGPAAEIFAAVITPPLSRRKDEWVQWLGIRLETLEKEVEGFKIENLSQDENFITTVMHASQVAIRNHHKEKLKALRNVVVEAAISPSPEDNLDIVFIRYIDELTPRHFRLLKFFADNEQDINHAKSYDELHKASLTIGREKGDSPEEFKFFSTDLTARGLLRISRDIDDLTGTYRADAILLESTDDNLPTLVVTSIGKSFLRLILEDS